MTLQDTNNITPWPEPHAFSTAASALISSATAKVAGVFQASVAGNLNKVALRVGAGTNAGNVWRISIQTVDTTTGMPTGTLVAAGAEVTLTGPLAATGYYEVTIGTPPALTAGQVFAIVVDSNTFVASAGISRYTANSFVGGGVPRSALATTGAYSASADIVPNIGFAIDSVWQYHSGNLPGVLVYSPTVSTTAGLEVGTKFTLPFGGKVVGCWLGSAANAGMTVTLYDSSNTVLATQTFAGEALGTAGDTNFLYFATPYTAAAGLVGRIAVKGTTTTNVAPKGYDIASSSYETALPGGTALAATERNNTGAWTDTATRRNLVGLLFKGIEIPVVNRKVKVGGTFVAA